MLARHKLDLRQVSQNTCLGKPVTAKENFSNSVEHDRKVTKNNRLQQEIENVN